MDKQQEAPQAFALENIITTAVKVPGVKVSRDQLLADLFPKHQYPLADILEQGPVQARIPQDELKKLAHKLILKRTSQSSAASFVTGLPGGLAMAASIPADVLQFFGMALRLAQELAYLYGAQELWTDGSIDDERVRHQLILYCGAMFGVSGAVSGVRVLSTQIAKTVARKLPQKALTKTFWYPIVKQIGKAIGLNVTKQTLAKGVSKAVPILGGVISGGLNFVSMMPMANRLLDTLEHSCFDYTEAELAADIEIIDSADENEVIKPDAKPSGDVFAAIEKLSKLKDMGAITQEEFDAKKTELLSKI